MWQNNGTCSDPITYDEKVIHFLLFIALALLVLCMPVCQAYQPSFKITKKSHVYLFFNYSLEKIRPYKKSG